MSEMAKSARAAARDKAKRLTTTDPHQKVDASSWESPEPMDSDVKTGMRPVSKTAYKRGGKVEGEHAKHHAGRKPRKSGGRAFANALVNRDDKAANDEREGKKHIGGFNQGGRTRAHKFIGGGMSAPMAPAGPGMAAPMMAGQAPQQGIAQGSDFRPGGAGILGMRLGHKRGGKTHSDEAEDKRLVKDMVKKGSLRPDRIAHKHGGAAGHHMEAHAESCRCHKCGGGSATEHHHESCRCHKCEGGMSGYEGTRPSGGREAHKDGGHITASERHKLPKRDFGLPGREAYPMPDRSHAANAKARASQMEHEGKLSESSKEKIDAKADRKLREHHAKGGKAGKGKTNINIVIAPGGDRGASPMGGGMQMPPPRPPAPPQQMPIPQGGPPGIQPVPVPVNTGAMNPQGAMNPMNQMPRKRGGRTNEAGAGSGLGRLQKIKDYGDEARPDPRHY